MTYAAQHEQPSRQLAQMAGQFAMVRGSRVACYGSADLLRVDASGRKRWLMQADEVLYLHPDRVRLRGPAIDVDADPLPDVVLEVDHTTDVRRRKLGIYKESGFPEVWVLVPWDSSRRAPGLAIHVRRGDGYREEPSSRAFPRWRSEEIHRALTEAPMSEGGVACAGAGGAGDGSARGHEAGGRSAHALAERKGMDGWPCAGSPGSRGPGPGGAGDCSGPGRGGRPGAVEWSPGKGPDGGGTGVHRCSRLPAAGSGSSALRMGGTARARLQPPGPVGVAEVVQWDDDSGAEPRCRRPTSDLTSGGPTAYARRGESRFPPRRLRASLGPCTTNATAPCSPFPAWSRTWRNVPYVGIETGSTDSARTLRAPRRGHGHRRDTRVSDSRAAPPRRFRR